MCQSDEKCPICEKALVRPEYRCRTCKTPTCSVKCLNTHAEDTVDPGPSNTVREALGSLCHGLRMAEDAAAGQALAEPKPKRVRGGRAVKERAKRCPVESCRAQPGRPCYVTMHGKREAIIGRVHPERLL